MIKLYAPLFFFLFFNLFIPHWKVEAQDLKRKKKGNETFYVLANDPNIKQGDYRKVSGKVDRIKGQYDSNKKVGFWEYYDRNGKLEQIYDYDNQQLIESNSPRSSEQEFYLTDGRKLQGFDFEQVPLPIGGWSMFFEDVVESFALPKNVQSDGQFYSWAFLFWVNEEGKLINVELEDSRGENDEIGMQAMQELLKNKAFKWIPAVYNGKKVQFGFKVPVSKR